MAVIILLVLMTGVVWIIWIIAHSEAKPLPGDLVTAKTSGEPNNSSRNSGLFARIRKARELSAQRKIEEQRQRDQELEAARSGTLTPINPAAVVLQKGETAFSAISATLLEVKTVRYRGGSTGVSFRVAKGVYLRQSAFRGAPVKGVVPVAQGTLVATNRRLIFVGDQTSAAISLDKILSFEPMNDGLRFGDGRKTYNFLMGQSQRQLIFVAIAERLLRERT